MPGSRSGTGLRLSITDDTMMKKLSDERPRLDRDLTSDCLPKRDEIWLVHDAAVRHRKGVSEFSAFVNSARSLSVHVGGEAT